MRGDTMNYKIEIIKLLEQLDNEKFLAYLYTLVKEMVAKNPSKRVG